MKNIQLIFALCIGIFMSHSVMGQNKKTETATFKVFGNCPMCKDRVEIACDIKGVKHAEWNVDTKMMTVIYKPSKITIEKIHETIAACGHDTELSKAPDEVYKKLPDCCLYREKPNTHHD